MKTLPVQISEYLFEQGRKIERESEHLQELLDEQVENEVEQELLNREQ